MKMCYLQKQSAWKINSAIWKARSDSFEEVICKIKSFDSDLRITAEAKDLSAVTVAQAQLEIGNGVDVAAARLDDDTKWIVAAFYKATGKGGGRGKGGKARGGDK